jgi:DNA repair protein RecN (Recombination protein N)
MNKVASGGELSRISLAIQMITAGMEPIPTLIFDEVDAGIGGAIAEVVGTQLRTLGEQRQVLCVTHLPQVAAQAHHHFCVSKSSSADTQTHVSRLDARDRIDEIARMLGGVEITQATRNHATEMIQRASEEPAVKTAS